MRKVIEALCHRSKAVGGAGSSRDDVVICSEGLMVNVVDDSWEIVSCRSRDNDLLSAGVNVSLCLLL